MNVRRKNCVLLPAVGRRTQFLPAVRRSTRGFFLRTVNSAQMLKLLIKGPETSETQHRTQFDHDTNVGMVTFGLGGHLEAKIASKKFA